MFFDFWKVQAMSAAWWENNMEILENESIERWEVMTSSNGKFIKLD